MHFELFVCDSTHTGSKSSNTMVWVRLLYGPSQTIWMCSVPDADPCHPRMAWTIHGWHGIRVWAGHGVPSVDPWMAWLRSVPDADPCQMRIQARCGWPTSCKISCHSIHSKGHILGSIKFVAVYLCTHHSKLIINCFFNIFSLSRHSKSSIKPLILDFYCKLVGFKMWYTINNAPAVMFFSLVYFPISFLSFSRRSPVLVRDSCPA